MYVLRPPATPSEHQAMHDLIARSFTPRPAKPVYDRDDPEDTRPGNHFLGYWDGDRLLGTIRIDLEENGKAVLRKGAIAMDRRHKNLGHATIVIRGMITAIEDFIRGQGYSMAVFGTAPGKEKYFKRFGYAVGAWPRTERDAVTMPTVDMLKRLTQG